MNRPDSQENPPTSTPADEALHDGPPWAWQHRPPPWMRRRTGPRRLVQRFLSFLVVLLVLFLAALGASYLLARPVFGAPTTDVPFFRILLVLCAVPFGFVGLAGVASLLFFRRIGSPLVDLLAAVDAVADGDLSVRVREPGRGELRRLASSFNRMAEELERAEQQRRNLTADVAHELRTPLHIIQGNLEGVLDGVYQPTNEHIQATLDETHLLARLVADLQTLSLAEAGQLPLHPVTLSAADLLDDVVTSFTGQAAAAGVELRLDLPMGRESLALTGDPDRLDQIFSNLVANALRHTPASGRVTLRAEPLEQGGVRIQVNDTGGGIAPDDLPFVFDRFWRADRARTRHAGSGSGLGLAIVRQLVHSHGGAVRVESELNRGATFTVELP